MFSKEQKKLIQSLGVSTDFNRYSEEDWAELEDLVDEHLVTDGIDENGDILPVGKVYTAILDILAERE